MQRLVTVPLVAALVALAACSGPADPTICTPGESRACACSDGRAGAQTCNDDGSALGACRCDGADAGPPADSGVRLDAGLPDDAGAELDAGPPPPRDSGIDAGPADGGPAWGDCWLLPRTDCDLFGGTACQYQDGCPSGATCRMTRSETRGGAPYGAPACESPGTQQYYDDSCCWDDRRGDLCGGGQVCVGRPGVFGCGCRVYCNPDGARCPAGMECRPFPYPDGSVPQPVYVCT
ncbi:MAG: hypothetical protein RLP09_05720 [Sandaracinaceae bacterium]